MSTVLELPGRELVTTICAWCKKVIDDHGIRQNTPAPEDNGQLSNVICLVCAMEYFQ